MGPIAISFGIACAAVLVTAAFCRSRDAILGAVVLAVMWGLTKVFHFRAVEPERIMLDAFCDMLGALAGIYIMHRRPALFLPWMLTASMMISGLLVVLWAIARNMGFDGSSYPYSLARNVLYLIALLSVLSLGLHDGAVHIRAWLCDHPRNRPWSRPGAKWGRTAEAPNKSRSR